MSKQELTPIDNDQIHDFTRYILFFVHIIWHHHSKRLGALDVCYIVQMLYLLMGLLQQYSTIHVRRYSISTPHSRLVIGPREVNKSTTTNHF